MRSKAHRILVPVNGGAASEQAFHWACQLARSTKSELHAIYVFEVPLEFPLTSDIVSHEHNGEEILARIEAIAEAAKCKVHASTVFARHAGPAVVLELEDRHMDLVVVGIPNRYRANSCSLGSTPTYILKSAPCQVILSREQISTSALARS